MAWEAGKLSADITEEQRKLTEADLIIFQFPIYWFTVPAILKGWIDRVLTLGYAFSQEKRYSLGVFKDTKAMLAFTTGSHESMFSAKGIVVCSIWVDKHPKTSKTTIRVSTKCYSKVLVLGHLRSGYLRYSGTF